MRVSVVDLIGKPGQTRAFARAVTPTELAEAGELGPADGAITSDVDVDLQLEAVVEGILVTGTIDVDLELPCSRCLEPQRSEQTIAVAELFLDPRKVREDEDDEDTYVIDDDLAHLDLGPLLRDAVVMEVPVRTLCRDDCAGLCPTCGTNRNDHDCGHRPEEGEDPRWAKLRQLQLPAD